MPDYDYSITVVLHNIIASYIAIAVYTYMHAGYINSYYGNHCVLFSIKLHAWSGKIFTLKVKINGIANKSITVYTEFEPVHVLIYTHKTYS